MSKPKVFVTRPIPVEGTDLLRKACEVEVWPDDRPIPRDVLLQKVSGLDGLLSVLSDRIDADMMDAAGRRLKVISNYAVGFDNIDIQAATTRGILVGNTPGVLTESTADFAFALLLAAARRVVEAAGYVRDGNWKQFKIGLLLGRDVHGATLGIVGMGQIGTAVARRARGFDMKVLYHNRRRRPEKELEVGARMCGSLEELLAESDFVSLNAPLTSETDRIINADALKRMKKSAVLINTGRGRLVDTDALYDALASGQIAFAALDVTDPEPLPSDHKLLTLSNCLVVPHIASASIETRGRMAALAAENLTAGITGSIPAYLVNPEVLPKRR